MKIWLDEDKVRIECVGLELLKLKALLASEGFDKISANKNTLTMAFSSWFHFSSKISFPLEDLGIKKKTDSFFKHADARKKIKEITDKKINKTGIPYWDNILEPLQANAVQCLVIQDLLGLCLFDEQGSGKTVMTIAAFDILFQRGELDSMIIVCPKTMVEEWKASVQKFASRFKPEVLDGTKSESYFKSVAENRILILNYEKAKEPTKSFLTTVSLKKTLLVVDESFYVKNESCMRSEGLKKLRNKCVKCYVLCGTPAPNSSHDLINQFNMADLEYTFGSFTKSKIPQDDNCEIQSLINTRGSYLRRLKEEILKNNPDKRFQTVLVEMKGRQLALYESARSKLELELKTLSNQTFKKQLASYFQKRAALLQICCCPSSVDETVCEETAKYYELDKLVSRLTGAGRKVVIWSFYKKSIDEIYERYKSYKAVKIDGSVTSNADRKSRVTMFQEDPNVKIFVGNPAAAGAGITLHASSDTIYVSFSNQAAHYLQSLDRTHRRGQIAETVSYYFIICKNTIEENEILNLRRKELSQQNLLGDLVPINISLEDALKELRSRE